MANEQTVKDKIIKAEEYLLINITPVFDRIHYTVDSSATKADPIKLSDIGNYDKFKEELELILNLKVNINTGHLSTKCLEDLIKKAEYFNEKTKKYLTYISQSKNKNFIDHLNNQCEYFHAALTTIKTEYALDQNSSTSKQILHTYNNKTKNSTYDDDESFLMTLYGRYGSLILGLIMGILVMYIRSELESDSSTTPKPSP